MARPLNDKVIVVTGGAGTIGTAFCRSIADNCGTVIIADVDLVAAQSLADGINATHSNKAIAVEVDIRSASSINAMLNAGLERYGRIDAVVSNAYPRNAAYGRRVDEVTYEDFCENTSAHLGGYFLTMQQAATFFQKTGGGNIVNMASIYGVIAPRFGIYDGTPMTMPVEYAAIKAAVIHLTRYFAQYYKNDGIRVNSISPGGVLASQPEAFLRKYSEMSGRKGMLHADDVSGSLLFLLSDDSRYLTGQNIVVDDGFSL